MCDAAGDSFITQQNVISVRITRVGIPGPPEPGGNSVVLAIIASTLVVEIQRKVSHLLLISQKRKGGASLSNDHWKLMAVVGVGAAAVTLLVEVAKRQAEPVKQAGASVPATYRTSRNPLGECFSWR